MDFGFRREGDLLELLDILGVFGVLEAFGLLAIFGDFFEVFVDFTLLKFTFRFTFSVFLEFACPSESECPLELKSS